MPWPVQPLPLPPTDGKLTAREWQALGLGALALTVLVVVVEPGTFGAADWVRMHSLYKAYCQSSVAQGRLPLWNPYHWLGRPFLADIESAFFYPPEWLYLVLDIHVACALTAALHYLLLLYGTVKLARALGAEGWPSLFSAFVFSASAAMVGTFTSGQIHYGQALCFAPLVFYLGVRLQAGPHRRDVALLAAALGLQILCGHPQAAWLTEVGLAVFLVGRRLQRRLRPALVALALDLGLAGLALVLGLALGGVALLPLAELAGQSNRPEASVAFAALFAEPSYGWVTLLVPTQKPYFGFNANAQLYAGLVPLFAGLGGLARVRDRNVRALCLLLAFALLLAAGEATPVFRLFFHVLPGMGWLRIHARATVLVTLACVLSAGLFLSRVHSRRAVVAVAVVAVVSALVAAGFCLASPRFGPVAMRTAVVRAVGAILAGAALIFWMRTRPGAGRRRLAGLALVALTALDVGLAVRDLKRDNRAAALPELQRTLPAVLADQGLLLPDHAPPRVFLPPPCENAGMTQGWSSVRGYSALALGRVWRHLHDVVGVPTPVLFNTFPSARLADFGPFPYHSMSLVIGVDPRTNQLVYNPRPDPRAYVATAVRQVRDDREATALIRRGHDFHATALVEQPLDLPATPATQAGRAAITHFAPERISVAVTSHAPALLVLAEPWFPGWSARVNGAPAPCIPANAWMRAVPIPAGTSEVVLVFRSTYLAGGAALSLIALALIVGLLARRRVVAVR